MKLNRSQIGILGLFLCIGIGLYMGYRNQKDLENHYAVTKGHIIDVATFPSGGGAFVKYVYYVNEEEFKRSSEIHITNSRQLNFLYRSLIDKNLPVVYE